MKHKTEKDFDAVEMMREIRRKLHKEYQADQDLRHKRLTAIRKKYGLADKVKKVHR